MGFGLLICVYDLWISAFFFFVLLRWFFYRHCLQWWGCGCAVISIVLTVVMVVFWQLNKIIFYYSVYIILLH